MLKIILICTSLFVIFGFIFCLIFKEDLERAKFYNDLDDDDWDFDDDDLFEDEDEENDANE